MVGRVLFGDIHPARFGSILLSIYTLFAMVTLDDWYTVYYYPIAEQGYSAAIVFFVAFIILETFIFVNLFVAVIVNNLQRVQTYSDRQDRKTRDRSAKNFVNLQLYGFFVLFTPQS